MTQFAIEQTFLLPGDEAAKAMSRMLIAGWMVRGATHSVRYFWEKDGNLVCLAGTQHPTRVSSDPIEQTRSLEPGKDMMRMCQPDPYEACTVYTVSIGGDTELVELFDGVRAYDQIYRLPGLDAARALRDSLDAVAVAAPPVTLVGSIYAKPPVDLMRGFASDTDLRVGVMVVPELGNVVQIMSNVFYAEDQLERLNQNVAFAKKLVEEELLLSAEHRVTRPLTYLLRDRKVQWDIRLSNERDFGVPEYNVSEYYEEA